MTTVAGPKGGLTVRSRDLKDASALGRWSRRSARQLLELLLSDWQPCRVESMGRPGTRLRVVIGEKGSEIDQREMRRQLSRENYSVFHAVLRELLRQSLVAEVAVPLAKAEMAGQKKRLEGASEAGKARAKPSRTTVERLMEAQLRQKLDPRKKFAVWAEEYDYSARNLHKILKKVKAGTL